MLAFIIAVAAGFGARYVRAPIEKFVETVLLDKINISKEDSMALSYAICLLAAAILISLSGSKVPVFVVLLGGILGLFAKELYTAIKKAVEGRKAEPTPEPTPEPALDAETKED